MRKELVISAKRDQVQLALLENQRLVELHQDSQDESLKVGDIILGRVKKVMPGMNAAFIDIGGPRDAFLHYTDMGPLFTTYAYYMHGILSGKHKDYNLERLKVQEVMDKEGKIEDILKPKQILPFQVYKEPISTKGPRMTTEVSIAGRYLILTPFSNQVGVSRKVANESERKRLKRLIASLKPKNFGVIIRTNAQGKKSSELHQDLESLLKKWYTAIAKVHKANPRTIIHSELDKTTTTIRDMLNSSFNAVITDSETIYNSLIDYIGDFAELDNNILRHHRGEKPIFDQFGVTKQIKNLFGHTVTFAKGPYLVLDHTEAMHVVDVNSGGKVAMKGDQETNALAVNTDAVDEIARQLRLRDLGGIIIIDFIDMREKENKKFIYDRMRDLLKLDKATTTVLPLSKFNLMQITRQRVRPQVEIKTVEQCPACNGTGKIEASILVTDRIEDAIEQRTESDLIHLKVHPYIHAWFTKGVFSERYKLSKRFGKRIRIDAVENLPLNKFEFVD